MNGPKTLGMTLVESMVAIVIGCISVAAVFYSYTYFNQSYETIVEKKSISKGGREALSMITRDLRNAGYLDVNYSRASWDRWIDVTTSPTGPSRSDILTIWYNTTTTDRVRIRYFLSPATGQNWGDSFLTKSYCLNPVVAINCIYTDMMVVPHTSDFQVILRDVNGAELTPVCFTCTGRELTQGTQAQGRENQAKAHTAELYITVRSPKEVYRTNTQVQVINHNATTGGSVAHNDRFFRETFFTSVYLRNIVN